MSDRELQEEEIAALKSIYEGDDLLNYNNDTRQGVFYAKINSTTNKFELNFVNEKKTLKVNYLTPIVLNFTFPIDYPSKSPPDFTLTCRWLNTVDISKLCKNLDDLWEKSGNCAVLFAWIYFLMEESIDFLELNNKIININNTLNQQDNYGYDKRSIKDSCSIELMRDYDKDEREIKFQSTYHDCNVCFMNKPGTECMEFIGCNHVFCNDCMKGYFEVQIKDGSVNNLTCPYEKCETQAIPLQVFKLVDKDLYKKYDSLLLRNSFNTMNDVIYCPRFNCQNPVIPDENLGQCQVCNYAFCSLCRQGYHGIEPCKLSNVELKKICEDYKNGDSAVREDLAKRYGAKRLAQVIEENYSMEYIEHTSKQCPSCKCWMQKLDGCNKMTCIKCRAYFCWLCLNKLSKSDPYSHFNAFDSKCFNKLFEGIDNIQEDNNEDDDNDDDIDDDLGLAQFHLPADPPPPPAIIERINNRLREQPVAAGGAPNNINQNRRIHDRFDGIDDVNFDQYAFNDDYEDFDDEDFQDGDWDDGEDDEEFDIR